MNFITGETGAAGSGGATGAAGSDGAAGAAGSDGAAGATGPQGPAGPVGPQGPVGSDGAAGATGPQGPVGPVGPQGPVGADGVGSATVKTKYPLAVLTEGSRVTSSISIAGDQFLPYRAFDGIYGANAIGVYPNPQGGGWISNHNDTTSSLIVNGVRTTGRYIYLDLRPDSTMAIITGFQIYSMAERFPIEYHFIGSNDNTNWASLYHTESAVMAGSMPHGDYSTGYTPEINLTSNYAHYRYVGLLVISQKFFSTAAHTAIQELMLYSIR